MEYNNAQTREDPRRWDHDHDTDAAAADRGRY